MPGHHMLVENVPLKVFRARHNSTGMFFFFLEGGVVVSG